MKNIAALPKDLKAVFTDLDDTLTSHGKITADTFLAMHQLKEAGCKVIIVSGRPAGWAECLVRLWPIDWMIFENGAGFMTLTGGKVKTEFMAGTTGLEEQKKILHSYFLELKKRIPQAKASTDQPYRLFDYAIDYAEDPPFLSENELAEAMAYLNAQKDLTVKLSSIHINYWCGKHTKVTACKALIERELSGTSKSKMVFSGDSPNDEPLFEFFENSVGVQNVEKYLPSLNHKPKFLTKNPCGEGFREIADHILENI